MRICIIEGGGQGSTRYGDWIAALAWSLMSFGHRHPAALRQRMHTVLQRGAFNGGDGWR